MIHPDIYRHDYTLYYTHKHIHTYTQTNTYIYTYAHIHTLWLVHSTIYLPLTYLVSVPSTA